MAQSPQPPAVGSPGSSPFRNIKPKTRKERAALGDKVALEHDRLMKRTGLAAKIYRENAPETSDGLVVPLSTAVGFMADADRFHTDTAGEAKRQWDAKIKRDQNILETKRVDRLQTEEKRWAKIGQAKAAEAQTWDEARASGEKAKRNASSVPYDMVTLQYHPSLDGEKLRYHDDKIKYRAAVRSENLLKNGGTRAGYDIVHGGSLRQFERSEHPSPSGSLKAEMGGARQRALQDEAERLAAREKGAY